MKSLFVCQPIPMVARIHLLLFCSPKMRWSVKQ